MIRLSSAVKLSTVFNDGSRVISQGHAYPAERGHIVHVCEFILSLRCPPVAIRKQNTKLVWFEVEALGQGSRKLAQPVWNGWFAFEGLMIS